MFRKKIIKILLLFILFFSCFNNSHNSFLLKYLNNVKNNKLKDAYKFLSEDDKKVISYDEFVNYEKSVFDSLLKKNTHYKIINSILSETKNRVILEVEIYQPDLLLLFAHFPQLTKEGITEDEVNKIAKSIKLKEYSRIYNQKFILVRENNQWKVFADYGRKKKIKELENLAEEKYKDDEYEESLNIANKLLEFDNSNKIAKDLLIKSKEKYDYIKNYIELNYYKKNNEVILKLKNKGNMILKRVTIEIAKNMIDIIGKNNKKFLEVDEEYSTKIKIDSFSSIKIKGIDF